MKPTAPSQVHPNPEATPPTDTRDPHVDLDGRDPQFGAALQRLGPAMRKDLNKAAFPTSSQPPPGQQGQNIFPSKAPGSNAGMMAFQARERIAGKFEQELDDLGRSSFKGRSLISAKDVKEALRMRDEAGVSEQEIERQLRLQPGILSRLARPGVYANV